VAGLGGLAGPHGGKMVPAPKALRQPQYKPIEPAPGRYVKAKA
jgi:polyhydroxyalkanoate synthase